MVLRWPGCRGGRSASYCWGVLTGPRLRQVALVARDGGRVTAELGRVFGWTQPFCDPGVGQFGLVNAVFAVGDTFVEIVAPARPDTTAGRYLERRGGDGGYMAIFQVPDLAAARDRVAGLGVRVVWTADLPDIAATHLHRAVTGELGECMDLEVTHHVHTALTDDHREAAQAFMDKREPRFQGR
jgi:hypothetical protein